MFLSYEKILVKDIPIIENEFNAKVIDSKIDYVVSDNGKIINYGKLKIYHRRESHKSFGIIDAQYVYTENDSIVKKVNYYWSTSKKSKQKDYSNQFDKTVKQISKDLGLSIGNQGKLTKRNDDTFEGVPVKITERRVNWTYNDTKILIMMVWSEKHGAYLNTQIEWKK